MSMSYIRRTFFTSLIQEQNPMEHIDTIYQAVMEGDAATAA